MKQALSEAAKAADSGEIPIGAVVVLDGTIIARASNQVELLNDPTAHAEILAITSATQSLGFKYLRECTLYVTLEPCIMCAGALFWSQMGCVHYAASDEKRGFMRNGKSLLHPNTKLKYGLLESESRTLLENFFAELRNK